MWRLWLACRHVYGQNWGVSRRTLRWNKVSSTRLWSQRLPPSQILHRPSPRTHRGASGHLDSATATATRTLHSQEWKQRSCWTADAPNISVWCPGEECSLVCNQTFMSFTLLKQPITKIFVLVILCSTVRVRRWITALKFNSLLLLPCF